MRFQDFFRFGVINLSRRKARTVLTALSMAIVDESHTDDGSKV